MARVYKTFFFELNIGIPTISGQGPFRNKIIAEMCYLYRRTGRNTITKYSTLTLRVAKSTTR